MERICDNNYSQYIVGIHGLIDSAPYNKEFDFYTCHICCMMQFFDHWFVVDMDIGDRCSNIVFDTGIGNYKSLD